jgi:DNA-binding transcriptional MerR regulator
MNNAARKTMRTNVGERWRTGEARCASQMGVSISDLAQRLGITTRTIRWYEAKGIITPRRVAGARRFSDVDARRLERVLCDLRLGFSLAEIRGWLAAENASGPGSNRLQLLQTRRARLLALRADVETALYEIDGEVCRLRKRVRRLKASS